MPSSHQEWNGDVWINDQWTGEEKAQALNRLAASRAIKAESRSGRPKDDFVRGNDGKPSRDSDNPEELSRTSDFPLQPIHIQREEHVEEQQRALDQFHRNASTNWNVFYEQNQNKFFKNRHYLHKAFPSEFGWLYSQSDDVDADDGDVFSGNVDPLETVSDADPYATEGSAVSNSFTSQQKLKLWKGSEVVHIVEIGCGVGNAILPLLEQHERLKQQYHKSIDSRERECMSFLSMLPQLHIHCLDFAPNAIRILKNDERFRTAASEGRATAHVYDLSSMHPSKLSIAPPSNECSDATNSDSRTAALTLCNSADIAILLFCLSATGPHPSPALSRAARHVIDMLKPGGVLVIRDYGRLDEAQLKLGAGNKELSENFYRKGDGTGCYYFELNDLKELFCNDTTYHEGCNDKLNGLELEYIQRVYRNRGDGTTRRRVWVQGRFQKPFVHRVIQTDPNCEHELKKDEDSLLQDFYRTSVQKWDSYYRMQHDSSHLVSLSAAIASKFPNNLLHMFPNEFRHWQSLLESRPTGAKMKATAKCQSTEVNVDARSSLLSSISEITVIDVGCGMGNGTLLNIVSQQQIQCQQHEEQERTQELSRTWPKLKAHFIDASAEAIRCLCNDSRYKFAEIDSNRENSTTRSSYITSRVLDITASQFSTAPPEELASSGDIALLLFTLSCLGPYEHKSLDNQSSGMRRALKNVASMIKPGGVVLFRDFGRYDDDQLQLNSCFGSQICENFYFRHESASVQNSICSEFAKEIRGTAVYFFELEEVRELFISAGFEVLQLECISRPLSKSGKKSKDVSVNGGAVRRTRVWIHGRFRKR
ncbi:hypothetical protein HJC23_011360 [Cyclotella cryptica]|uniref:Methyltransferase-like protein n=1 Tax=Cyclotella cryptica TaxID=29204 RepID=A0ABD3QVT7_9STRA|eukprot:CCRYP_001773-RA/>CCRYP_001773-RA protein AED:0.00 eAED:0.00 QI:194/-1/1/1/-1/1/1/668/820